MALEPENDVSLIHPGDQDVEIGFHRLTVSEHTNEPASIQDDKICRICLEHDSNSEGNYFVAPCKCAGSIGFLHSKCVKKSIICSFKAPDEAIKCDICKHKYNMSLKIEKKWLCIGFTLKETQLVAWISGLALAFLATLYLVVSVMMYTFRLLQTHSKSAEDDKKIILILGLLCSCYMLLSLLGNFIWNILKERFEFTIINWKINDYDQDTQEDPNIVSKIKDVQKNIKSADDLDAFTIDEIRVLS